MLKQTNCITTISSEKRQDSMQCLSGFSQVGILTKLELCNLYGVNVFRFSKDKKAKKKTIGFLALWIALLVMVICYVGGFSYGLIFLGLEETVPAYLITLSGLMIFMFGMLKAGSVIFRREGYDILSALPVSTGAVAISRILKMYVEDLLLTLLVLLPGLAVYTWNIRPGAGFYPAALLGIWSIPLIPMAASILAGTLITGIASRMRHKSLIAAGLSILSVLGILCGTSRLSAMEGSMDPEMLQNLSAFVMEMLESVYPPAVWLGSAVVRADISGVLLCAFLSLAVFAAVAAVTVFSFRKISQSLYGSFAKHNYQMGRLRADSLSGALCKREFRRYFSSSVYVTNTILGPIMGCVLAGAVLLSGVDFLKEFLPLPVDLEGMLPLVTAGMFCMMPATAVSVSMEGKNWWIVKSLPLSVKNILDAKILMNLLLELPFYVLAELFLIAALRPSAWDLLWLVLVPAVMILFSSVYGITINLYFPVMEWENEVRIVKQSASAAIGGLGGLILAFLCAVAVGVVPGVYTAFLQAGICVVLLIATAILYRKNNRFNIYGKI